MHAGRQPAARDRRRGAQRIGHRGGEGAALLPAVGHPPPRPARVRDRGKAAAACRARHPADPGRGAAGRTCGGDHRPDRCRRRGAVGPRGADRRPRAPGRLRVGDRLARTGGRGHSGGRASRPGGRASTDTHPPEAIELLRTGKVEVAVIFRYDETEPEPAGVRLHHLLDDPVYALSTRPRARADRPARRDLDRRLRALPQPPAVDVRRRRLRSANRLQLRRHGRDAGAWWPPASEWQPRPVWPCAPTASRASSPPSCPASKRHIYAATYGEPPDPPATAALLAALAEAAASASSSS